MKPVADDRRRVGVAVAETPAYPAAPFSPGEAYPEYRLRELGPAANPVYAAVREAFRLLGLDSQAYGAADWNPLGGWIKPGMRVLLKPNLVRHFHPFGLDTRAIYTHGSVVRAVADYAWRAMEGEGELVVGDAPLQSCDFEEVCRLSGISALARFYQDRDIPVEVRDLRLVRAVAERRSWLGKVLVHYDNEGDPAGYTEIDLGPGSLHARRERSGRYRVPCYDPARMGRHHGGGRHSYVIANTLLRADVVLNLPKMKTHHKAGITGCLKNFIGINGHKDCLPHHVQGPAEEGGDEYARASRLKTADSRLLDYKERHGGVAVKKAAALAHRALQAVHGREEGNGMWDGGWHGNDTISRTTIDLNRIVRYADVNGVLRDSPQRHVLSVVDGIVAGEKDGPLAPAPLPCGVILAGVSPAAVDTAMARLMGYRWQSFPTLRHAWSDEEPLEEFAPGRIECVSNDPRWMDLDVEAPGGSFGFQPHPGWKGYVEL
ncbi:MAG: DUF362 domain-containing protein [Bryobacterales bacterium]|nr:DUF362 domain-containing protein [Bryobacterales bacterium]